MIKVFSKLFILLSVLLLTGAGCISFSSGPTGSDGGIFKSVNGGEDWLQKSNLYTSAGVKDFKSANLIGFVTDPQDHLAIYASTQQNGMFYSYDGGESWRQPDVIKAGFVADIAVDQNNKCTVYVATINRILKSTDCNRTFEEIHRESSDASYITAFAISPFNSAVLYAGTIKGGLLKSIDAGKTWVLEQKFADRKIIDIILDNKTPAVRYVALYGRGVWKTQNDGSSYDELSEGLRAFTGGTDVRRLIMDKNNSSTLLLATKNKLLRSADGGISWEKLPIISPESIDILTLAVNVADFKGVYYGTATTFYKSNDEGQSWSTKKLPTSRAATALFVDPKEKNTIYLGVTKINK